MASELKIFYFGDDEAYFRALQGEFKQHLRMKLEFKKFFERKEEKIQSLFLQVSKEKPACIFFDFSKLSQDYLHLARIINRTPFDPTIVTVGLVDYLSPLEILSESFATGVQLSYVKSAETFDVVFALVKQLAPKEMGEHGFASAKVELEVEAGNPCKIGYVHEDGFHFETDFPVRAGEKLLMTHYWQTKAVVPSGQVFVKSSSTADLFYQFKQNADVEFLFKDELVLSPDLDPAEVALKEEERQADVKNHRDRLRKWLQLNMVNSLEKRAKILVIDGDFSMYRDQPRTDKHPYTIRCVASAAAPREVLSMLRPQVIAFVLESGQEGQNSMDHLKTLVKAIFDELKDDLPFLLVFNCATSSSELQEVLGFPQCITSDCEFSGDLLLKIASVYDSRQKQKVPVPQTGVVFIKKTNVASICEIILPIKLLKLSESDVIFESAREIPSGMNLHLRTPVEMYVHVVPGKSQGQVFTYQGFIHGIGEEEKKELRRFVNTLFFREHDEKKKAELDTFQQLNEAKLKEKLEALSVAQETKPKPPEPQPEKINGAEGMEKPVEISSDD